MENDITQVKQEIEELKKAVLEMQRKLGVASDSVEPSEKPRIAKSGTFTDEMTEARELIHESLGGESLILGFNLKGFCASRGQIQIHEMGFIGLGSFMYDSSLFFIPADKVRENRECPEGLIEKFFSIFSSGKRVALMRALLDGEIKTSAVLKQETGLTEGQFYHHMRELAAAGCLLKKGQDQYRLSDTGEILLLVIEALASELRASVHVQPADIEPVTEVTDIEDGEYSNMQSRMDDFERHLVLEALERNGWDRAKAAAELGIPRPTLNYKMTKHNVIPPAGSEA